MANWYYYDNNGQKQGPINDQQLQTLVAQGIIIPQTQLETESGHKGLAGQIPGLNFPELMPKEEPDSIPNVIDSIVQARQNNGLINTSPSPAPASTVNNATQNESLNRQTYILLAAFLGFVGFHCFYAKYDSKGYVHQGLLVGSIPLFFIGLFFLADSGSVDGLVGGIVFLFLSCVLLLISWIIAYTEFFYEYDGLGRRMKE